MEVLEAILYFILTLILLALIGVLSWLIYDYYEYKKIVKSKISETVAQSDDSNSLLKKEVITDYDNKFVNTSNLITNTSNYLLADYIKKFNEHNNHIIATSNILRAEYINNIQNTSNILRAEYINNIQNTSNILRAEYINNIQNTSNILRPEYNTMLDNSSSNLNKFFSFGIHNDDSKINDKIHKRVWSINNEIEQLNLIKNTIAKSNLTTEGLLTANKGVKIHTNAGTVSPSSSTNIKGLELCNNIGTNCWNLFVDATGDLKAVKPNDVTNNTLSFSVLATLATAPAASGSAPATSGSATLTTTRTI
jgi:hypothetical protein